MTERRGNEGLAQNTMANAIGRGTENNVGSAPSPVRPGQVNGVGDVAPRDLANVGGMAVGGIGVSVKPVAANHLEGSSKGDHRQRAADAQLPANPAPRENMTQSKVR